MTHQIESTVVGVFTDRRLAEQTVRDLRTAGFAENQVSFVGKGRKEDQHNVDKDVATGAAVGAAAGAGTAALVSLGFSFGLIPVVGPILAIGPLAAALLSAASGAAVGAAAGGLIAALIDLGVSKDDAKHYEGEVRDGKFLVVVRADGRAEEAWTILERHGAYRREAVLVAKL